MNKQEAIYRMFASRAAVLQNESLKPCQKCKARVEVPINQLDTYEAKDLAHFLSDVVTAAGLLSHGKTDKTLARRISETAYAIRAKLPIPSVADTSET